MKADLTLPENRNAFRAQYLNSPVIVYPNQPEYPLTLGVLFHQEFNERMVLSLRHISSLTEEEMIELVKHVGDYYKVTITGTDELAKYGNFRYYAEDINGSKIHSSMYVVSESAFGFTAKAADWLRRKGFLVGYAGNSCDDLIASGVAVYREERKEGA